MSMQFFGCYFNLFRLMAKCGVLQNLLKKEHVHTFVNTGGDVRELDFRFFVGDKKIGAPFHGLKAFFTTPQLSVLDKVRQPVVHARRPTTGCAFWVSYIASSRAPQSKAVFDTRICKHPDNW